MKKFVWLQAAIWTAWAAVLVGVLLLVGAANAGAQQVMYTSPGHVLLPRFVIMDDYIRAILIKDWDAHKFDKPLLERGYCLKYQLDFWADGITYRVTQISAGKHPDADVQSIAFDCEPGDAELHVHPAQTCFTAQGPCWAGGPYGYQCAPSDQDREYLVAAKQVFGMVQCTREGTVFYFAPGDNR